MRRKTEWGRPILALLLAGMLLFTGFVPAAAADDAVSDTGVVTVDDACRGVVRVIAIDGNSIGSGSGFGVGTVGEPTDTFVTNWHVITNSSGNVCSEIYIMLDNDAIKIQMGNDGSKYISEINYDHMLHCTVLMTTSGYPDVAVIRADKVLDDHIALALLSTENAQRTEEVYALGFPGDGDYFTISENDGSGFYACTSEDVIATDGMISRFTKLASADNTNVIQHTADINHGNSGGPLVDGNGAVIGINTYGIGETSQSASIYIDYAMELLNQLGISYDVYTEPAAEPEGNSHTAVWIIAGGCAAAVIAAVLIIVLTKKKNKAGQNKAPAAPVDPRNLRLQGVSGVFAGRRFAAADRLRIGRNPDCNELIFPTETAGVSGSHCELFIVEGQLCVRDLNSRFGTFLNGNKLPPMQNMVLHVGDCLSVGSQEQSFRIEASRT